MSQQQRRVVIAAREDRLRRSLREGLESLGYVTWGEASDGMAALLQARRVRPHLVVLAPPLPSLDGAQVAETLIRSEVAPVVLVLPEAGQSEEAPVREETICAPLAQPFTKSTLAVAADQARQRFERLRVIRGELRALRRERGGARLLERAKSLLIRRLAVDEPEAFWRIQRRCLDSAQPARAAVEAMIAESRLVLQADD